MANVRPKRLKVKRLTYVSSVTTPAQQGATPLLFKSGETTARVVKLSDELGLIFLWAVQGTVGGVPLTDRQGDQVDVDDPEFIAACAEFMESGGPADVQHNEQQDGQVVFAMPMNKEIAGAFGIDTGGTTGLMIALKPSPEVFQQFKDGTLGGVSIAGEGSREDVGGTQGDEQEVAKGAASLEQQLKVQVERYAREHKLSNYAKAFADATADDDVVRDLYEKIADQRAAERGEGPALRRASEADPIAKTRVTLAKAEVDLRSEVSRFGKANGISRYEEALAVGSHADPEVRKAYEQVAIARKALADAPMVAATAKLDVEIASLRSTIAKQAEAFGVQHDYEPAEAHERLLKVSPSYRAMHERVLEAGMQRDIARERAQRRAQN